MAAVEAETEQLGIQLSSMDLNSQRFSMEENSSTSREEKDKDVFYDDYGLALNFGFDRMIVVENIPVVREDEVQELESEIREIFSGFGVIDKDGFSIPLNPQTLKTMGYCFIQFSTRQEAELAVENRDGYKYGNSSLSVTIYDDLHTPVDLPLEETTLELEPCSTEQSQECKTDDDQNEDECESQTSLEEEKMETEFK